MGGNSLGKFQCVSTLSKLKYLSLENTNLTEINLSCLKSLVGLNLSRNRFQSLPDLSSQDQLQYLDMSGNRLETGFHQLKKCTSLRVLDISNCKLSFNFSEFKKVLFDYIRKIQKLQYLAIKDNPVASIPDLRLYIIRELPELKVLDWNHVTKEDRVKSQDEGLDTRIQGSEKPKLARPTRLGGFDSSDPTKKNSFRFTDAKNNAARPSFNPARVTEKAPEKEPVKEAVVEPPPVAADTESSSSSTSSDDEIKKLLSDDLMRDLDTSNLGSTDNLDIDFAQLIDSIASNSDFYLSPPTTSSHVVTETIKPSVKLDTFSSVEDEDFRQLLSSIHSHPSLEPPVFDRTTSSRLLHPQERATWDVDVGTIKFQKGLGQGTFGGTFLAKWTGYEKPITVKKLISMPTEPTEEEWKRLVTSVMSLTHPNLVQLIGGCRMGAFYVLSNYIEGTSVFEYLQRSVPSSSEILYISRSVASALTYLHGQGIIHGSLKTKNIFLPHRDSTSGEENVGSSRNILVKDYGFLSVKSNVAPERNAPEYMAPELLNRVYSTEADVYSFGMVLLAIINGCEPHEGMSPQYIIESLKQHKRHELPSWPPALVHLINICTDTDPSKRPGFPAITEYLAAEDHLLFPAQPTQQTDATVPSVVEDIEMFVLKSASLVKQDLPKEEEISIPQEEEEETPRLKIKKVSPLSKGVDDKSEQKKLNTVLDKLLALIKTGQTQMEQKAVVTLGQIISDSQRLYYLMYKHPNIISNLAKLVNTEQVGRYELTAKVVELFISFSRHLIGAEKLAVKKNFQIIQKVLMAKNTREEDVSLITDNITLLTVMATTLPSVIEDMISTGVVTKVSSMLRAKTTLPAQKIPLVKLIQVLAQDADNKGLFIDDGIVDMLFQIYQETRIPQLKLHVMEALSNFVFDSALSSDQRLLSLDLPDKIFKMASSEKSLLRNSGFSCLNKLCQASSHLGKRQTQSAIQIFSSFLKAVAWDAVAAYPLLFLEAQEEQELANIGFAVKSLALLGENKAKIIREHGGVRICVDILSHLSHTSILWPTLELTEHLLSGNLDAILDFKVEGGLKKLVSLTGSYDARLREKSLHCLLAIAEESELTDLPGKKRGEEEKKWEGFMKNIASILSFSGDIDQFYPASELCGLILSKLESSPFIVVSDSMSTTGVIGSMLQLLERIELRNSDSSSSSPSSSSSSSSSNSSSSDDDDVSESEGCVGKILDTLSQLSSTERGSKTILQEKSENFSELTRYLSADITCKNPDLIWNSIAHILLNLQSHDTKGSLCCADVVSSVSSILSACRDDTRRKLQKFLSKLEETHQEQPSVF
eukprot:TRINITY_DN2211_c0_g1_i1.p1 TRINITY_DN2211_c0_g1~~TRINITY_DN2211_c0_g1_i1.p1  ORF type:complete len:1405 (+),score=371.60 TRINITY_DN2211_c0_g1_i1:244-4215(+)